MCLPRRFDVQCNASHIVLHNCVRVFFNHFITSLNLDPILLVYKLAMPAAADSSAKQVKRRACDECRKYAP